MGLSDARNQTAARADAYLEYERVLLRAEGSLPDVRGELVAPGAGTAA